MPSIEACTLPPSNSSVTTAAAASHSLISIRLFMNALLISYQWIDADLCHHAAIILGIIAEKIEVGGVEEIGAGCHAGGIDDHIHRLAAANRHGHGVVGGILANQWPSAIRIGTAHQSRACSHYMHVQSKRAERVEVGHVEIGDAQQDLLS